jgi:hypothetical protein
MIKFKQCFYCDSNKHNVEKCIEGEEVSRTIMYCGENKPNFEKMNKKLLKTLIVTSFHSISNGISNTNNHLNEIIVDSVLYKSESFPKKKHKELVVLCSDIWYYLYHQRNIYDSCPICYEEMNQYMPISMTKCNHKICTSCFVKTIQFQTMKSEGGNIPSCPMCRQNIY